jgi:hypothetical protein
MTSKVRILSTAAISIATFTVFIVPRARAQEPNIVIQWNNAALQGVRDSKLGPPMVARALFIVHNCIYDAWAAYDNTAVGTVYGASLRRPSLERTLANKNEAISFAAYRASIEVFPGDKLSVFDPLMAALGYDINDNSVDTTVPDGIGNVVCSSILNMRHHDGSNQLGDMTASGVAYALHGVPSRQCADYCAARYGI